MPLMGFREYARHRAAAGLAGGTLAAVQTAIRSGRIVEALVGAPGEPRKIDQSKADALWTARTDVARSVRHAKVKPAAEQLSGTSAAQDDGEDLDTASYAAARAARERANARKAQLEVDALQGKLVDAEAVASVWEKIISTSRTKVLALPSKIRTRLPQLTAADVSLIEGIVRDTLDELAEGRITEDRDGS